MEVSTLGVGAGRLVNTITAGPLLNLLLALRGFESPGDPQVAWEVFKQFAVIPSSSEHDVLGFQVAWIEVDGGAPTLSCSWIRQLTDDAAGYGSLTRAIQLEYAYLESLLSVPDPLEVWSDEFASSSEFLEFVERQPQFKFILETQVDVTGVYVREADGPDGDSFQ